MWVKAPQPRLPSAAPTANVSSPKNTTEPPIVLVRTVASRQVIVAVNDTARQCSIHPEMTLAEARAICADVRHVEHDPYKDAVTLEALGRWMMRFSPVVSLPVVATPASPVLVQSQRGDAGVATTGKADRNALFLDVTGCEKVFHGLDRLIALLSSSLSRLRISAAITIAPTPGAAWALTFSPARVEKIITPDELPAALNPLAPFTLRLDPQVVESLHHLGLERIEQIEKLPRDLLPARFGQQLLQRLDQAFGRIPEPLIPLKPFTPIAARMDFEAPIDSLETIWLVFRRLIGQVIPELAKRGRGARELDLEFFRPYEKPIHHTIRLSRASRDPVNWFNLMRCALEGLEERRSDEATERRRERKRLAFSPSSLRRCVASSLSYERFVPSGFTGIRLAIRVSEKISEEQIALLEHEQFNGEIELSHLIERLRVRMGRDAIVQVELAESHLPEQAFRGVGVSPARSAVRAGKMPTPRKDDQRFLPRAIRPLRLLAKPEEIRVIVTPSHDLDGRPVSFTTHQGKVHRLEHAVGPERIAGQWWVGHDKTRDYFDVEDSTGKRFWIFRVLQSARWFVQGHFE